VPKICELFRKVCECAEPGLLGRLAFHGHGIRHNGGLHQVDQADQQDNSILSRYAIL
jgi:hypothetical protein